MRCVSWFTKVAKYFLTAKAASYGFCRVASYDSIGLHIVCNNRSGGDDTSLADGVTRGKDAADAYPAVVADGCGQMCLLRLLKTHRDACVCEIVVVGNYMDFGCAVRSRVRALVQARRSRSSWPQG